MKTIPLSRGFFALVDDEDYEGLSKFKWYANGRAKIYAARRIYIKGGKGKSVHIYMQKELLCLPPEVHIDHINSEGLDNRKCNLRIATQHQNCMNQRIQRRQKSSRFKGVTWDKSKSKWMSQINLNKRHFYLVRFYNEEDAAMTYNKKAKELFGEFALLNVLD